jgi:hypothetical protein
VHPNDPNYADQYYLTKIGDIEKIWDEYSGPSSRACTPTR